MHSTASWGGKEKRQINWGKVKEFDERRARNKYDDLIMIFKIWNEMKLKWTGLGFDRVTSFPQLSLMRDGPPLLRYIVMVVTYY